MNTNELIIKGMELISDLQVLFELWFMGDELNNDGRDAHLTQIQQWVNG